MTDSKSKPKVANSASAAALDEAQKNFDEFDKSIKAMTLDRMNEAPKEEKEPQTKLSSREIANCKDHYLKPHKVIGCSRTDKFNEKFREEYNFMKTYVPFIAEQHELKGETIDLWTRPFPGMPAEEWLVPTNKPVWGPRYLAEQIRKCSYHRLVMQDSVREHTGAGTMYGQMAVDTTVQRLDAHPVNPTRKSVFMGAENF